jgi:hypothetical protein
LTKFKKKLADFLIGECFYSVEEFLNYWTGLYRAFFTYVSISIMFTLLGMISPHNYLWWLMDETIEWRINKHWYVGVLYNFKGELYGCIGVYVKYHKTCRDATFVTLWMWINQYSYIVYIQIIVTISRSHFNSKVSVQT